MVIAFWLSLGLTYPIWSAWDPTGRVVAAETRSLGAAAAASLGFTAATYGFRWARTAWAFLWVAVLLTCLPVGLWEAATGRNLTADPWFGPVGQPSAAFGNPNNFTAVLLLGLCLSLQDMLGSGNTPRRLASALLALTTGAVLVLAGSRAGILGLLVILFCCIVVMALRAGAGRWARRHPVSATLIGLVWLTVTMLVLFHPRFSRYNLVARIVVPDRATTLSDGYRLELLRWGVRFWSDAPWMGIGGGRFETRLHEAWPSNPDIPHLHNTLLEVLVEYGLVPAALLAGLIVALAVQNVTRLIGLTSSSRGQAQSHQVVFQTGALVALVYGAVIIDSALGWLPWWLMLATAVTLGGLPQNSRHGLDKPRRRRAQT